MNIALQIDDFKLTKFFFESNDIALKEEEKEVEYAFKPTLKVLKAENINAFKILYGLKISPQKNKKYSSIKVVEIGLEGYFSFPDDFQKEHIDNYIKNNCVPILHGIARGIISNITGNTKGGVFILPAFNFVELFTKENKD